MSEVLPNLHLMRPEWLWALVPAAALAALLWYARGKGGSWSEVISPELLPYLVGDQRSARGPNLLPVIFLAWFLAVIAAAGPAWQKLPQPVHRKQDALVLVLDLSYSMMAQDLSPSRLVRARQKILDLLKQRGEGQTGLIAYAGDSHIVTPLTDDNPTIANLVPALNPGMMPVPGSDPVAAISQAIDLLHSAGISDGKILLITDAVDPDSAREIPRLLRGSGATLAVMGVGTPTGAPIPLPQGGFIKDGEGTIVIPRLEEPTLRKLAAASGGQYARLSLTDADLETLLTGTLSAAVPQTVALGRTADAWEDQGYLLIILLLPVVLALFRRGWIYCLLPLMFLGSPQQASAQSWDDLWLTPDQQGQKALQNDDPKAAASLFENPDWAGTAAYQGEDFERAVEKFAESDSADSWYNRGNALAKSGDLDKAIEAYKKSLERQPDQPDALENIELLEKLKQQQEQQQNQQQDQQNNQQDEEQDQQNQEQQSQNDNQQPQDQQQDEGENSQDQGDQSQDESSGTDEQNEQGNSAQQDSTDEEPEQDDTQPGDEPEQATEENSSQEQQQAGAEPSGEDQEQDQAMEQWLRRVPDDPSGLLREKFRYESRQREQESNRRNNETYW